MDHIVIKLKEPVKHGETVITELSLRKPKAKDFRTFPLEGATMGDVLNMLGKLSGQPPSVIDEMGSADLMAAAEVVGGFLPAGPATGKKR